MVIDASVWVSYLIPAEAHHQVTRRWLGRMLAEGRSLVAPILLLAEVGGAVARQTGRPELGDRTVDRLLALPPLRLVAIDAPLGVQAAHLAAGQRLRGADAVYVALAAVLDIPLVSWDQVQLARAAAVRGMTPT